MPSVYSQLSIQDFRDGLNTDHPTSIPDHALAKAENIQYTQEKKVAPKPGMQKRFGSNFDSSPVIGIAPYYKSDGTTRLIMAAGTSLYQDTPHLIFNYDADTDWNSGVTNLDTSTTAGDLKLPLAPTVYASSVSYQAGKYGQGASIGTSSDYVYTLQGGTSALFRHYTKGNVWSALTNVTVSIGDGGALVAVGSDIYALQGGNTNGFLKYSNGAWSTLAVVPVNVTTGGALVYSSYNGGYLYAFVGGSTAFYRYSISGNTWSAMAVAPATVGAGGSLVSYGDGSLLYALLGGGNTNLYTYDVGTNVWGAPKDTTVAIGAGASLAWDGGSTIYILCGNGTTFRTYSATGGTFATKAAVPAAVSSGGSLVYDGTDSFYCFRGGNTADVYRYRPSLDSWDTVASASVAVNAGGSLTRIGDYLYALTGGTGFYKYAIPWKKLAAAPVTFGYGASLCYTGGDYLYALQGGGTTGFYRYSISGNSWANMAVTLGNINLGGSLVFTGGDYIYATRGNVTGYFDRYSISGNSWVNLANTTGLLYDGAGMVWTGGDYIYATQGGNATGFYRYSISGNSWTGMTAVPGAVNSGGSIQWGGGDFIYVVAGNATTNFYRYSISGNSWASLAATPVAVTTGGTSAFPGGDYINLLTASAHYRYSISGGTWSSALLAAQGTLAAGASATSGSRPNLAYLLPKPLPKQHFGALWYIPNTASASLTNIPTLMSAYNTATPAVQRYALTYAAGAFHFKKNDGTWYSCDSAATSFSAGNIIFLAWLDDPTGGNMKLWVGINGAALSVYTLANSVQITDAKKVYWGCNAQSGNEADGVIDDPQVYDVSLMAACNAPFAQSFVDAIYTSGVSQTWGLFTLFHSTLAETTDVDANRQGVWVSPSQNGSTSTDKATLSVTWTADVLVNTTLSAQVATSADGVTWSAWYDQTNGAFATAPANNFSKVRFILQEVSNAGTPSLHIATASYDGTPSATVLLSGLAVATNYSFAQLQDTLVACNGVDIPKQFNGSTATDLSQAPRASVVCVYKNRMFMAKDANNKSRVYFSALANIQDWTTANNAGLIDVNPNDGDEIMALVPMDTTLLVVKGHQSYYLQGYSPQTFQITPAGNGGTLSPNGVIWTQYGVFRLDREGVWATNFATQVLLTKEKGIQKIWDGLNQRQLSKAALFMWQDKLLVAVPDGSSAYNNLVLVYDIANKVWSKWTGWAPSCFTSYWERGLWLYLFGSGLAGNVYQIVGSTDDGVAFTSTVETKHFALTGLDHMKRVKWADFSFAGGTVDTTIGLTSISDGTESAEKTVVIPANQDNYPVRLSTPAYARTMGFKVRWVGTGSGGATFLGMDVSFFPRASRPTRVV